MTQLIFKKITGIAKLQSWRRDTDMNDRKMAVALTLFRIGAIKFGQFELKMHEAHPGAPKSPIYLNLRTRDNPKPGPLDSDIIGMISELMLDAVMMVGLDFDVIAGIPNAGDPFADALAAVMSADGLSTRVVQMTKVDDPDGKRHIADVATLLGDDEQKVLLVDDLITMADTKLEAVKAINDAERAVEAIVVLVDREQGGAAILEEMGIGLVAVFTLTELLDLYVDAGFITPEDRADVQSYKQRVDEYMASLEPAAA